MEQLTVDRNERNVFYCLSGYCKHMMERSSKWFALAVSSFFPRVPLATNGVRHASSYYTPRPRSPARRDDGIHGSHPGVGPTGKDGDGTKLRGSQGLTRMNIVPQGQRMGVSPFFLPMNDAATDNLESVVAKPSM